MNLNVTSQGIASMLPFGAQRSGCMTKMLIRLNSSHLTFVFISVIHISANLANVQGLY